MGIPNTTVSQEKEDLRTKISKNLTKISKQTWKVHLHIRVHANVHINYLDSSYKRDGTLALRGLDLNLVKPRGRLHINIGLMLKNLLISLNTQTFIKQAQRSIFDGYGTNKAAKSSI